MHFTDTKSSPKILFDTNLEFPNLATQETAGSGLNRLYNVLCCL